MFVLGSDFGDLDIIIVNSCMVFLGFLLALPFLIGAFMSAKEKKEGRDEED